MIVFTTTSCKTEETLLEVRPSASRGEESLVWRWDGDGVSPYNEDDSHWVGTTTQSLEDRVVLEPIARVGEVGEYLVDV